MVIKGMGRLGRSWWQATATDWACCSLREWNSMISCRNIKRARFTIRKYWTSSMKSFESPTLQRRSCQLGISIQFSVSLFFSQIVASSLIWINKGTEIKINGSLNRSQITSGKKSVVICQLLLLTHGYYSNTVLAEIQIQLLELIIELFL